LIFLLAACTSTPLTPLPFPTGTSSPNLTPTSTIVLPTQADVSTTTEIPTTTVQENTITPELAIEPTLDETPQLVPTLIPQTTAVSTAIPQPSEDASAIQIYGPGPQSKIISPLNIYGYAIPGYQNKGYVNLYGEDGRLLASELLQLNTAYKWAYFYWPVPFEIHSAGELGRLSMSTQDKYGRITALTSVNILLLPEGASIVNPPGDLREHCVIEQPFPGQRITGGLLSISGKMLPFNNLPLRVELIDRDGIVANSQLVPISFSGAEFVSFRVDIPYTLSKGTWELLSISQFDDRIGGLMYLYGQEFFLNP
jgi:hypothetical protein